MVDAKAESLSLPRIRALGCMEQFHLIRNYLGCDTCVIFSAQYTATEGARLCSETLYPALRSLIEAHTPLGIRFEGDEASAQGHWVRLPSVDLSRIVEFAEEEAPTEADLERVLEAALARGFVTTTDLPLWRVRVLADNTVVGMFHHAIADGMSTKAFHLQLFRALQKGNMDAERASAIVPVPQTLVMHPTMEQALDVRPTLMLALRGLFMTLSAYWYSGKTWTGNPCATVPDATTHVRIVRFSAQDAQKLLVACRAHQSTLTGALHVLIASAVSQLITKRHANQFQRLDVYIPLGMRGAAGTGIAEDEFMDCASTINPYTPVRAGFSWADAAKTTQDLKEQKMAKEIIGILGFFEGKFNGFLRGKLGKKRGLAYLVSNVGRWTEGDEKSRWKVANTVFTQCDVVVGGAFNCCIAGDPSGGVNLGLSWGSGVDAPFIDEFISSFEKELSELFM